MKTIIVTGGAGFIGSHVVDRLVGRGWRVHVVDDLSTGRRDHINPQAELHVLDIRSPQLSDIFMRCRPATVIHLAAQIDLQKSMREPVEDASINVVGGVNVIAATLAAGSRHFVFASSAAAYGPQENFPLTEDLVCHPALPYGIAKFAMEHHLHFVRQAHNLPSAALRFANVYGPRQSARGEAGVVAVFLERLKRGEPCVINGDGRQTRDFVFVGDVADAVVLAVDRRLDGVFNVGTGRETEVSEIFHGLKTAGGFDAQPTFGPAKSGDDRRNSLDSTKLHQAVGWRAQVPLDIGLAKTAEWACGRDANSPCVSFA